MPAIFQSGQATGESIIQLAMSPQIKREVFLFRFQRSLGSPYRVWSPDRAAPGRSLRAWLRTLGTANERPEDGPDSDSVARVDRYRRARCSSSRRTSYICVRNFRYAKETTPSPSSRVIDEEGHRLGVFRRCIFGKRRGHCPRRVSLRDNDSYRRDAPRRVSL